MKTTTKLKINKNALSLMELLMALVIGAFIVALTCLTATFSTRKIDIIRLKNANLTFKSTLNNIMSNSTYYSEKGLTDTSTITVQISSTQAVEFEGENKFKRLFLHEADIANIENNQHECYAKVGKDIQKSICLIGENGILWHIPDTDFKDLNMVEVKNASGLITKYLPITIYPSSKFISSEDDFLRYAIVLGARRDGTTTMIYTVDCSLKEFQEYNQCLFVEYTTDASYGKG